jgi:GNAT superfamily N-acetyltransferase
VIREWFAIDRQYLEPVVNDAWEDGHRHLFPADAVAAYRREVLKEVTSYQAPVRLSKAFVAMLNAVRVGVIELRGQIAVEFAVVEPLMVDREHHRQGVGSALWKRGVAEACGWGCLGVRVWALAGNPRR